MIHRGRGAEPGKGHALPMRFIRPRCDEERVALVAIVTGQGRILGGPPRERTPLKRTYSERDARTRVIADACENCARSRAFAPLSRVTSLNGNKSIYSHRRKRARTRSHLRGARVPVCFCSTLGSSHHRRERRTLYSDT